MPSPVMLNKSKRGWGRRPFTATGYQGILITSFPAPVRRWVRLLMVPIWDCLLHLPGLEAAPPISVLAPNVGRHILSFGV